MASLGVNSKNVREETLDKSPAKSNERRLPIVPRPIRPPVGFTMASYSAAVQWLSAASHFPPWLFGTRFMRFLPGR